MGKVKELESEIPEFNPETHKWDREIKKVVELTPEELAEIARIKRKIDLNKRADKLLMTNLYYFKAFGGCFSHEKEVLKWNRDDLDDFEQKVLKLEAAKKEIEQERPMLDRRNEYRKIDEMLLEGLAEQEEGRPQMLARYMTLRRAIKERFPK